VDGVSENGGRWGKAVPRYDEQDTWWVQPLKEWVIPFEAS